MAAVNYAEQYSRALANAYPQVLHFAALRDTENDKRYKFVDAKTIRIPVLKTGGRTDADRDTVGEFKRDYDNSWETKTLTFHREWSTLVHPMDIDETNEVASIVNITQAFNEQQKFPEMDDYLVSKLYADWKAAGEAPVTTTPTISNILELIDNMMLDMDEADVPAVGRILYVTPQIDKILKSAEGLARQVMVQNNDGDIARRIANLDSAKIEKVPSKHMKTVYDLTVGSKPGTAAKQINMFLVHPSCVITPEKYEFSNIAPPSATTKGKYVYYEESYGDVFILNERVKGLQFNVEA